jgi:N-acetylglucosaminyldiphosphoundecaprenol N-acetyl-beta-D-mannosaminyltransferase
MVEGREVQEMVNLKPSLGSPRKPYFTLFSGTMDELVGKFKNQSALPHIHVTPNLDHWRLLAQSASFRRSYSQADTIINDSRLLDVGALRGRALYAPGADLVPILMRTRNSGTRIFVVGCNSSVEASLSKQYPNLLFDFLNPPMGFIFDRKYRLQLVELISSSKPSLVLICTGAPQSEVLAAQLKASLRLPVDILCCGSALLFMTGSKRRAPFIFRHFGAEWLWRFVLEPHTRLRYILDMAFLSTHVISFLILSARGKTSFKHYSISSAI